MQLHDTAIPEVKRVTLRILRDERGYFCERYVQHTFEALGIAATFVQDNVSYSMPGVLRGLHLQHAPVQGKLVGVTRGRVLDVAVDVRPGSPTYTQYIAAELSEENGELLWIPPGFAHGFCVLGDAPAQLSYKLTAPYAAVSDVSIRFNDSAIGIRWPVENPILSARDAAAPALAELEPQLRKWFA